MNKLFDEIDPAAVEEFMRLETEYGISRELIRSIITSKSEGRAHIGFFKRMMLLTNGIAILIGGLLTTWGVFLVKGHTAQWGWILIGTGLVIASNFTIALRSMHRAITLTEHTARKHMFL